MTTTPSAQVIQPVTTQSLEDPLPSSLQRLLVFCIGGKGGVGKTLVCRLLFYFYMAEQIRAVGFDADRENPEFRDYHKNSPAPVQVMNFQAVEGMRTLMECLHNDAPPVVLLDMPAASGSATREQFARYDLFNTLQHEMQDYKATVIAVLNNGFNSIGSLGLMMEAFGDQANYVAVLNQMWAVGEKPFTRWHRSAKRKRFLELNGIEVHLPMLDLEVFDLLHGMALPFWEMDQLGIADRVLLRSFLNRSRAMFDPAAHYLGLAPLTLPETNESALADKADKADGKTTVRTSKKTGKSSKAKSSHSSKSSQANQSQDPDSGESTSASQEG